MLKLIITIVVLALCFDFINGFHDGANAIATSVSTRVLTMTEAIIMSAAPKCIYCFYNNAHNEACLRNNF